jgi:glycosyltransferase involved in cell wall biosynthesis
VKVDFAHALTGHKPARLESATDQRPDISVTVPVFNEVESLQRLRDRLLGALGKLPETWEVIFVNDGSTDGTAALLDEIAASHPAMKVVHFRRNFGQTAAMQAGFDFASGEIIVPMDADLQNDPDDIPLLLAKLREGFDVCSGWRSSRKDAAIRRNFVSRIANRVISSVSGVRLHDYGCTLKAYRRDVISGVKLYGEMHRFVPIYASWMGARVTEIPVHHHARQFGRSKYGLERIFKVIMDLLVVKFLSRYTEKPMYVFGGAGVGSLTLALAAGIWAVYLKLFQDVSFVQTPLPLFVVFFLLTGLMCFLMGLLAEMLTRIYHESQGKSTYLVRSTRNIAPATTTAGSAP